jgi:hypothetical protein
MKKIGIGVDYSNICKDYNTVYLDRDNKDPATTKCMKQVLSWLNGFLSDLLTQFNYKIHYLNAPVPVKRDDLASKRFLFYSLEKEITLQSYVMQKTFVPFDSVSHWEDASHESILVQNEEDGGGITFFVTENSDEHLWIIKNLELFSLDDVSSPRK